MTPDNAFHQWEEKNNHQDLSDRDRVLWISGYLQAHKELWGNIEDEKQEAKNGTITTRSSVF